MSIDNIHWLGHDSFRIEDQGKIIYIDPWKLSSNAPKADYIFITHSHYDHFSIPDIEKLSKSETKVIGPADVTSKVKEQSITLEPGQFVKVDLLEVEGVPAYNTNKSFHPKENKWLGFVIKLSSGTKVYHAGDTDFIPEMKSLKADIALLPVSGTYVMTADEAIEAAHSFNPSIVIPMHFGDIVGDKSDAQNFKKGFNGTTVIKEIEK